MSVHDRAVLICGGVDFQAAITKHKPCPTGAEACGVAAVVNSSFRRFK